MSTPRTSSPPLRSPEQRRGDPANRARLGFRGRLTVLISVVFVAGGLALLGVQYLLVQQSFGLAIGTLTGPGCEGGVMGTDGDVVFVTCGGESSIEIDTGPEVVPVPTNDPGEAQSQTSEIRVASFTGQVLGQVLLWSIGTLVVFTGIAVAAAYWLSGRSFSRIAQITATTREITAGDLGRRLDLPGPADEVKELGDTIDTMLDRLQASFAQQQRFVANASHELRTPLATTRTVLEIPLQQGRVPDDLAPTFQRAIDANRRSERLISALLALARVHAGRTGTADDPALGTDREGHIADGRAAASSGAEVPQSVDLSTVVAQALERHEERVEVSGLNVEASLRPSEVSGLDPALAELAVDNLLDNTIRHNQPGGRIWLSSGVEAGHGWIEVSNSGSQLDAASVDTLREPFNRGAATRLESDGRGLGLGLALVESIAAAIGGRLLLHARREGGLTARLQFPSAVCRMR